MQLNIENINLLIESDFESNQSRFARATGINRTQLNKVLSSDGKFAGKKFYDKLIEYCQKTKKKTKNYIFF